MPHSLKLLHFGLAMCAALFPSVPNTASTARQSGTPDSVILKNGREKAGRVVFENEELVVLRQGSHDLEIERAKIENVESLERSLSYLLDHHARIKDGDTRSLADAAKIAEERGLFGIADLFNLKVLLADPKNEAAHKALGHRKRSKEWTAQLDGKWHLWRELIEIRRDWNKAWQFETAHYSMRSNLPLKDVVQSLLDLERFYLFFHETIGAPMGVRGVTRPLVVHIFGDEKSYVQLGDNRPGWYDPETRTVNLNGMAAYRRRALFHEATHQLLEVKDNGGLGTNVRTPAWLGEGLAEYLAYSAFGEPGRVQLSAGLYANGHLYTHSNAEHPESLDNLLALGIADFLTSKPSPMRYAQAYTLALFCLHGEDEKYREDFLEYCAVAIDGKGSPTNFKKLVCKNSKDFEAIWTDYVKSLTGGR